MFDNARKVPCKFEDRCRLFVFDMTYDSITAIAAMNRDSLPSKRSLNCQVFQCKGFSLLRMYHVADSLGSYLAAASDTAQLKYLS